MIKRTLRVVACCSVIGAGACDSGPSPETGSVESSRPADHASPAGAGVQASETVKLYWTGQENGQTVIKVKEISKQAAAGIIETRRKAREAAERGASPGKVETVQQAANVGSTDWTNDCQYYSWFLVTSQSNGGGDIFCANHDGVIGSPITMPFVPAYYDRSSVNHVALCTSSSNCWVFECGPWGSGVWNYYPAGSGTGNISPPSNVNWITTTPGAPC